VTKHERIMEFIRQFDDGNADPHYAAYFALFNRQKFYEAHDALEDLWLEDRQGPNGNFFKGLIQLAGAFVHLQKNRLRPSAALFKLARANFEKYSHEHEQLDLKAVQSLIGDWLNQLEGQDFAINPLTSASAPQLTLIHAPA
jgi:predicted metal-dependent hydrolase